MPLAPMLATRGDAVPTGEEWWHEVKWDGMRVLVSITCDPATLRLHSRNGNDVSASFPEIAGLADHLSSIGHQEATLDAEVVAFVDGLPSFTAVVERLHSRGKGGRRLQTRSPAVTLMVFDVLSLDGVDLTRSPLQARRAVLERLDIADDHWQTSPVYDDGELLLEATRSQGLEGIVSKARGSVYQPGVRSHEWLKFPHRSSRSVVIGGWRGEKGSAQRLGAVLVGVPTYDGGLAYLGRVGSGVSGRKARVLQDALERLGTTDRPFTDEVPREDATGARWVRPELVIEVESLGLSSGGRLRQPAYKGLRDDLSTADLAPEDPALTGQEDD